MSIAVIGCGYWGKNIVRNMAEIGVLSAVCDHSAALSTAMSETYKVPARSVEEIFADSAIKGVAIAAPAVQHYALSKAALLAGKDVFVEKPLALHVNEAKELCELAKAEQRILMVGHLLQYHPAYLKLKDMVLSGDLGRLQYLYSNRLSLGKIRQEEDVLWSFAPHDISMILGLVGVAPDSISASGSSHVQDNIADMVTTHLSFPGGVRAHVFVSWLHPFKEQKLVVVGDKGMAVFDDTKGGAEKLMLYPHKIIYNNAAPVPEKAEGVAIAFPPSEPLRNECQHFLDCMESRAVPRSDGYEGLSVLCVLQEASKDLEKGQRLERSKMFSDVTIHETAYIDDPVSIGAGTKIWHFSHVLPNTIIGKNVVIGQNCVLGPDVRVGDQCKIQNNVSLYKGVILEDGVFCGPSCVFTNVNNPRAEIERKTEYRQTLVKRGTTIGANATIVCGHTLGEYSFIAAGAVVTNDVPAYALMAGVPAKRIGWMSRAGSKLGDDLICPLDGTRYQEKDGCLNEISPAKKPAKKDVANG